MFPGCLVVKPPMLFDLVGPFDSALRPVHIRNVGLPPDTPLDPFWGGICSALGIADVPGIVESFVDRRLLRSYFNSHGFSVDPARGLMAGWWEFFQRLAVVASSVGERRIRILPPTYNYPYHLHDRMHPR